MGTTSGATSGHKDTLSQVPRDWLAEAAAKHRRIDRCTVPNRDKPGGVISYSCEDEEVAPECPSHADVLVDVGGVNPTCTGNLREDEGERRQRRRQVSPKERERLVNRPSEGQGYALLPFHLGGGNDLEGNGRDGKHRVYGDRDRFDRRAE